MEDNYPILCGEVLTPLKLPVLAKALGMCGEPSRIGESCHYTNGRYLHIQQGEAELRFDEIEPSEYLVAGDARALEELNTLAQTVSVALQQLALKYRFEIYLPPTEPQIVSYFHHDWPLD